MFNHIDNLRKKPEGHRRRVQLFASVGITAFIFAVWAISFTFSPNGSNKEAIDNVASPFGLIKDNVSAAVVQVKDGYVILKEGVK